MSISIEQGQKVIDSQNFSQFFKTKVTKIDGTSVELQIPIGEHLSQQHGFVLGGAIAYAVDNSLTFSGALALGFNVLTSEFKVNFVRPVFGEKLIARARTIYAGKTQAVVACEIFVLNDGQEKLCAAAQGTIVKTDTTKK